MVNFEHISLILIILVFALLDLNKEIPTGKSNKDFALSEIILDNHGQKYKKLKLIVLK